LLLTSRPSSGCHGDGGGGDDVIAAGTCSAASGRGFATRNERGIATTTTTRAPFRIELRPLATDERVSL